MNKKSHASKDHNRTHGSDRYSDHKGFRNESIGQEFSKLGFNIKSSNDTVKHRPQKGPDSWKGEGVDHIRIGLDADTELGKLLHFYYDANFKHDIFGKFRTIQGFWSYLRSDSRDEAFRTMTGHFAFTSSRNIPQRAIKHVRAMVMDSAYQAIKGNAYLYNLMFENELPFDVYFFLGSGVPQRDKNADWIISGYTEIRNAIQGGTEPDFKSLCDPGLVPDDIYVSVRPTRIPESVKRAQEQARRKEQSKADAKRREERNRNKQLEAAASKKASEEADRVKRHEAHIEKVKADLKAKENREERNEFNFNPKNSFCAALPVITENADSIFLPEGRRTVRINGIAFETGFVTADVSLPLFDLTNNQALQDLGLLSDEDVFRSPPLLKQSFIEGFVPKFVTEIGSLAFADRSDQGVARMFSLPAWQKIAGRQLSGRDGHVQTVEENDGELTIRRKTRLYVKMSSIKFMGLSDPNDVPDLVNQAAFAVENTEAPEKYEYAVLELVLEMKVTFDPANGKSFRMSVGGYVSAVGASTNGVFDDTKDVVLLPELGEGYAREAYVLMGYTFTLYRGKVRAAKVKPAVAQHEPALVASADEDHEAGDVNGNRVDAEAIVGEEIEVEDDNIGNRVDTPDLATA